MEVVRLRPECISCVTKKHLNNYPATATVEEKLAYMQQFMKVIAEAKPTDSAPILVHAFDKIQEELFGTKKDYTKIKKYFNEWMLSYEEKLSLRIQSAKDPLRMAIQYAMVGNFIDFGAMDNVDENKLEQLLNNAAENSVCEEEYIYLQNDICNGQKLVYITDNCGEIVLDKLLIRVIKEQCPQLDITVLVRGGNVLNDATIEDAKQVRMLELASVMGNGNSVAGTVLDMISDEAKRVIDKADVVIAKGQANFETMRYCGKNIYYIFMCKCQMFANNFQVPQYTGILTNDRRLDEFKNRKQC